MGISNLQAKILNATITKDKFVNKPVDEYIYASLSQPPLKILDKNNSEDELDYTVECPNCHKPVVYGNQIYMLSGKMYCDNEGCRNTLISSDPYLINKWGYLLEE